MEEQPEKSQSYEAVKALTRSTEDVDATPLLGDPTLREALGRLHGPKLVGFGPGGTISVEPDRYFRG